MRRFAPALPVPQKMFRHFAVVTILITACIALFADGERRDAIGDELAAQQQKTAMAQAETTSLAPNKTKQKKVYYPVRGSADSVAGAVEPAPMVVPKGVDQNVADQGGYRLARDLDYGRLGLANGGGGRDADYAPPGLAELREGKQSGARSGPGRKPGAHKPPTAAQVRALDAAAIQRAGLPTPPKG